MRLFLPLAVGACLALELGLRLAPDAVPFAVRERFSGDIRKRIEVGQTLFRHDRFVAVPRDDDGPDLEVLAPGIEQTAAYHAVDLELGAVETVTTDETGFCNPPTHAWSTEDVDTVVIGDSYVWCTAVAPREAWPALLEGRTGRATYNLGFGGVGIYEYVQILKRYGLPRHPRTVVLNVFENDVANAYWYWQTRRPAAAPNATGIGPLPPKLSEARDGPPAPGWERLARRVVHAVTENSPLGASYAVNVALAAGRLAKNTFFPKGLSNGVDFRYTIQVGDRAVDMNEGNRQTDEVSAARAMVAGKISPALLEPALAEFADLASRAGFRPIVTYAPAPYTAYEGRIRFRHGDLAELMPRFSRAQRAWLRDAARRHGLDYIDLTPAMQEAAAAGAGPLYFPRNLHLTAAGHRVIAAALAEALRRPEPEPGSLLSRSGVSAADDLPRP